MYELKKMGSYLRVSLLGLGPSSYEKRIYRAAVSQRLRDTGLRYIQAHKYRVSQAGMGLRYKEHVFTCFLPPPVPSEALAPNYLPSLSPLSVVRQKQLQAQSERNCRRERLVACEKVLWCVDGTSKLRAVIPCVSGSLFRHCCS